MQADTQTELKVGDAVYFQDGRLRRSMHICSFHEFEDSVTISYAKGIMETICRRSEIRLKSEVDAEEKRAPFVPLIEAWESGLKTNDDIAAKLGIGKGSATHQIKRAKEFGYIK